MICINNKIGYDHLNNHAICTRAAWCGAFKRVKEWMLNNRCDAESLKSWL